VFPFHLLRKYKGLVFIKKPIRGNPLLDTQKSSPASYNPEAGVVVTIHDRNEAIPCIGYGRHLIHCVNCSGALMYTYKVTLSPAKARHIFSLLFPQNADRRAILDESGSERR
jgi:hypothetical protein